MDIECNTIDTQEFKLREIFSRRLSRRWKCRDFNVRNCKNSWQAKISIILHTTASFLLFVSINFLMMSGSKIVLCISRLSLFSRFSLTMQDPKITNFLLYQCNICATVVSRENKKKKEKKTGDKYYAAQVEPIYIGMIQWKRTFTHFI